MKQKTKVSPNISQPTNSTNVSEPRHGGFFEEFTTLGTFLDGSAEVSTIGEVHDQAQPTGTNKDLSSVVVRKVGWFPTLSIRMKWDDGLFLYIINIYTWNLVDFDGPSVLVDVIFFKPLLFCRCFLVYKMLPHSQKKSVDMVCLFFLGVCCPTISSMRFKFTKIYNLYIYIYI